MRYSLPIVLFLLSQVMLGQDSSFHLDYRVVGLGGNRFYKSFPLVSIDALKMTYMTNEKKTGRHTRKIRPSSVDSIIKILEQLRDTVVFRSNVCVLSGACYILNIVNGPAKLRFTLLNTFDSSAQRIVDVLNLYLPKRLKIEPDKGWMEAECECLDYLRKKIDSVRNAKH